MSDPRSTAPDMDFRSVGPICSAGVSRSPIQAPRDRPLSLRSPEDLDCALRHLSRREAFCRRVLGKLAARFLRRHGHHDLGFARLGDFTRERLGLSAREVQTLAQVTERLNEFPLIALAFDRGELSWTQVRRLVGVASEEEEGRWLALARGKTVRALDAAIRESANACARKTGEEIDEEEGATIDGEPRAHFRMLCPPAVKSLWREVVALARQTAGEELRLWHAAEIIAAEASSSLGSRKDQEEVIERAESRTSGKVAEDPVTTEAVSLAETFPHIDWSTLQEAIPEVIEKLAEGSEHFDAFTLDECMRQAVRALQRIDWQTGKLLRIFLDLRFHHQLGFSSGDRYVRERLGISPRKAQSLLALDRKGSMAPELLDADRDGKISWLRALALVPVVSKPHAVAWTERAIGVTLRRLNDEVEWALAKRESEPTSIPVAPPPARTRLETPIPHLRARGENARRDTEISFAGPMSVVFLFRSAVYAFAGPGMPRAQGLEKLLRHVKAEWGQQPRHSDPVFARDGWRCAVPICTSRKNLHDHHVVFRSRGGDNTRENRSALCAWHHLRGIHQGRLRARGKAPSESSGRSGYDPAMSP